MPAVVIEEAALNYSSTIDSSLTTTTTLTTSTGFSLPFPLPSISSPTDVKNYWNEQQQTEEQLYPDSSYYLGFIEDDENFGSPLPFDASENGLWNGRFVPPPPRPPFLDDAILADGVTTCDLCSWAMPQKKNFILDETIEKASELGWPLAFLIVSVISAIIGAIIVIAIVRCRRKKTVNRNETHVQWFSRNKRPNSKMRRNNIYIPYPADSIRGPPNNTTTDTCNWNFVVTS